MIEEDQTNRLNADQKVLIKDLFSQGVKHKMKVNLGRQLSRPSGRARENSLHSDPHFRQLFSGACKMQCIYLNNEHLEIWICPEG